MHIIRHKIASNGKYKQREGRKTWITADPTSVSAVGPLLDVISLASDSRGLCSAKMGGKVGQRMPSHRGNTKRSACARDGVPFCRDA